MTSGIDSITMSTRDKSATITSDEVEDATDKLARVVGAMTGLVPPDHQTSFDAVAAPLEDVAERVARLHVNIREHADEMKGDRKELRNLKATLKERLAERGYIGDNQLAIPGFRGFNEFTFAVETKDTPIMVESGDTKTSTALKIGSKRIRGWRR